MLPAVARRLGLALARGLAGKLGFDVVRRSMYSPVPDVSNSDPREWERRTDLAGLVFDLERQFDRLETVTEIAREEFFTDNDRVGESWAHYSTNGYYRTGDAEVLYGMIRRLKPQRILELGTGYSTMIAAMACARNSREGTPVDFTSIDPEPRVSLPDELSGHVILSRGRAQELPAERYGELGPGDFLVVDTTHTVRRGGDVNHLVLEILPRLRSGVVVHFHDVFLPYDYPREWHLAGLYLSEQYLLQAYLADNPRYEVLLALFALSRQDEARFKALMPMYEPYYHGPSAFWIRRT